MGQSAGAVIVPDPLLGPAETQRFLDFELCDTGLNAVWRRTVESVVNREGATITVDLETGQSTQEFSTRLRMFLLFMNRHSNCVSTTISPTFIDHTYPAMLALVNGFNDAGAINGWRPDGPRTVAVGKAKHLFVSVDMPIRTPGPAPDILVEIVAAHRISASWYRQRVLPLVGSIGLTKIMLGIPELSTASGDRVLIQERSIFHTEREKNLSGRPGGVHFSRRLRQTAPTIV